MNDVDALLDTLAAAPQPAARGSTDLREQKSAAVVATLEAAGAGNVRASDRREWVTFDVNGAVTTLYWSQRDGVYYLLREPVEAGALREIGRFHNPETAVAAAMSADPFP